MPALHNLESLFARVQKPARYTGGEWNSVVKDWDACDVRVALAYPDLYDIGMSNMGIGILYDIVNRREGMLAERVFAPWSDLEAIDARRGRCRCGAWRRGTRVSRLRHHRLLAVATRAPTRTSSTCSTWRGLPVLAAERDRRATRWSSAAAPAR